MIPAMNIGLYSQVVVKPSVSLILAAVYRKIVSACI